jgi:hypothetical protein
MRGWSEEAARPVEDKLTSFHTQQMARPYHVASYERVLHCYLLVGFLEGLGAIGGWRMRLTAEVSRLDSELSFAYSIPLFSSCDYFKCHLVVRKDLGRAEVDFGRRIAIFCSRAFCIQLLGINFRTTAHKDRSETLEITHSNPVQSRHSSISNLVHFKLQRKLGFVASFNTVSSGDGGG